VVEFPVHIFNPMAAWLPPVSVAQLPLSHCKIKVFLVVLLFVIVIFHFSFHFLCLVLLEVHLAILFLYF
jgi:hypothetical protein